MKILIKWSSSPNVNKIDGIALECYYHKHFMHYL